jgi:hypothetical protein
MSLFLDLVAVVKKGFATGLATGFFSTTEFSNRAGSPSKGFGAVVTSPIHDPIPVILDPAAYNLWFDPSMTVRRPNWRMMMRIVLAPWSPSSLQTRCSSRGANLRKSIEVLSFLAC